MGKHNKMDVTDVINKTNECNKEIINKQKILIETLISVDKSSDTTKLLQDYEKEKDTDFVGYNKKYIDFNINKYENINELLKNNKKIMIYAKLLNIYKMYDVIKEAIGEMKELTIMHNDKNLKGLYDNQIKYISNENNNIIEDLSAINKSFKKTV